MAVAVVTTLGAAAPGMAADRRADPVPDDALLQPEDVRGAAVRPGGPDATHPLPPLPCGKALPEPTGARVVHAVMGSPPNRQYTFYAHVARYPRGGAAAAVAAVRQQLEWCEYPRPGERFQTAYHNAAGTMFLRDFDEERRSSSYFVGHSDDYLVAVLNAGREGGDVTMTGEIAAAAVRRIGGQWGPPIHQQGAGRPHWAPREAAVHAARLVDGARTVVLEATVHTDGAHCGHLPRIGRTATTPASVRATVLADDLVGDSLTPCTGERRTEVDLHLPSPEPPPSLVLNGTHWVREGDAYQRR